MIDAQFKYQIEPEDWPTHLTKELREHFERVGFEGVQWDVVNHNYGTPEKHYAALYWLGLKRQRRQRVTNTILAVAILTFLVSVWSVWKPIVDDDDEQTGIAEVVPDSDWFNLVPPLDDESIPAGNSIDVGGKVSISYKGAVFMQSDIALPDVSALSGRAKFLPPKSTDDNRSEVGYVVSIEVDSLDQSKLPDKYKEERVIESPQGPLTILPLEEAIYEVYFILRLLDQDGFEILEVETSPHNIQSGMTNQFQDQTDAVVTSLLAKRTNKITLHMVVAKCLSARQ